MGKNDQNTDMSTWAVGGAVLLGLGAGFLCLDTPMAFIACLLTALGLGLVMTAFITAIQGRFQHSAEKSGQSNYPGKQENDRSSWAIGGCIIAGLGVGLFYLPASPMVLVTGLLAGIGLGLVITPVISAVNKRR